MGNLIQSKTEEELDQLLEKENSKPKERFLYLPIWNLDIKTLKNIKINLSKYFDKYQLDNIDCWINYLNNNDK